MFEPALCNTLDIYYDRFGFMLAFGDLVWVPATYIFICYKILLHNPDMPMWAAVLLVILNTVGYILFRGTNYQKHLYRTYPEEYEGRTTGFYRSIKASLGFFFFFFFSHCTCAARRLLCAVCASSRRRRMLDDCLLAASGVWRNI